MSIQSVGDSGGWPLAAVRRQAFLDGSSVIFRESSFSRLRLSRVA